MLALIVGAASPAVPPSGGATPSQTTDLFYLIAAILFIVALYMLTSPRTARLGNAIGAVGMLIAVAGTLLLLRPVPYAWAWIISGLAIGGAAGAAMALGVRMTAMPTLVSFFNGTGGLASALVSIVEFWADGAAGPREAVSAGVGSLIGCLSFTGSMIASAKLQEIMRGKPVVFPYQKVINAALLGVAVVMVILLGAMPAQAWMLAPLIGLALVLGVLIVLPVGGADMPVVIAMLNSFTGLAAAATGFLLANSGLIIAGALVGASGAILTVLMCRAMNRSLANVLFEAVGLAVATGAESQKKTVRRYTPEDAKIVLENAAKVVIIPGYGLAVARAQHVVKELATLLEDRGIGVKYAIHPVAGRMPGHMNVLMAEADVPYAQLLDLDAGNSELESADVAMVIGANDVVNPAAYTDPKSPIYGMPILNADRAKTVMIIKRSLAPGFAGVDNDLFYRDGTMMLFGDAKEVLTELVTSMKGK
ncbi:MAG: NAD(P)(+) transhydrogenase (Re/Si-specific) subunit beta [Phycisphaerae bacterium]